MERVPKPCLVILRQWAFGEDPQTRCFIVANPVSTLSICP